MKDSVLLISFAYYPAPGGAANYTKTLAELLVEQNLSRVVSVFTEKYPGAKQDDPRSLKGRVRVRRRMLRRSTKDNKNWMSFVVYAVQMIQVALLLIAQSRSFDAVLIHGSLVYRTSILCNVVRLCRKLNSHQSTIYILDVRDPLLPRRMARCTEVFDSVIACSTNVERDLVGKGVAAEKVRMIPIPLSKINARSSGDELSCANFGLVKKSFVLVSHGFTLRKRSEEVVDAVEMLRTQGYELRLAVIGRARYWPDCARIAVERGWLTYIGQIPNEKVHALMSECLIHVNVCSEEGLPRSSLEALAAGALTVLPPGVREFEEACPQWIGTAGNPALLAEDIKRVLRLDRPATYPVAEHYPGAVASKYRKILTV